MYGASSSSLGESFEPESLPAVSSAAETSSLDDVSGRRWLGLTALASSVLVVGAVSALRGGDVESVAATGGAAAAGSAALSARLGALEWKAGNSYTRSTGKDIGVGYPWRTGLIVEPHRPTTLEVTNAADGREYTWHAAGRTHTGETAEVTFTDVGTISLELREKVSASGADARTATGKLHVKYVRREIRDLNDVDREAFFDTSKVLYTLTPKEGLAAYGDRFKDINFFVQLHNVLAGARECDHMHDGLGFIAQHAAFTLVYEKSLQLVDPKVTVPYWDYTIEAHYVVESGTVRSWRESIVFSDDWFGDAQPTNLIVERGRFARVPITGNAWNLSVPYGHSVTNAWGLVRSPWNQNKVPFVTRHNMTYGFELTDVPSCQDHYDVMQETEWTKFGVDIQYNAHGTVHAMIGGVWGADFKRVFDNHGYRTLCGKNVGLEAFATQKNLWRSNQLNCPTYCAADMPASECKCSCTNIRSWLAEDRQKDILSSESPLFYDDKYLTTHKGTDIADIILKTLCNDFDELHPTIGDSLESASPIDISFWPTHPTIERLYQWRRINGFTNSTWVNDMSRSVSFKNVGYCWGHNFGDVLVWENLIESNTGPYTNEDLWNIFDPTIDNEVPYVYDNFEWPHCEAEGYPITLLNSSDTRDDDAFLEHATRQ